jgi:RimJ/RimL family protein N-acetyltransferase
MNIEGNIVTLRAIEETDLVQLHKWANDPQTQDIMGHIHFPSSMDFHKTWFQQLKTDDLNHRFAIELPMQGIIGISSLMNIDWRNNHGYQGIMIGDSSYRGKGYSKDALLATMRYAFDELHLERLEGNIIEYNTVSYSFYTKLGWKEEGRKRNFYFRRGRYWDQIFVSILKNEYYNLVTELNYWSK